MFFPTLAEKNVKWVIDMGDTFDNRTGINYSALAWAKDNYYDRLKKMGIQVYTVVGNHTAYYKNTNSINAVDLLLREYDNVHVISEYQEIFCMVSTLLWFRGLILRTKRARMQR